MTNQKNQLDLNFKTLSQIEDTYTVMEDMINSLSDKALNEILGGCGNDLDNLFSLFSSNIFNILYGEEDGKNFQKVNSSTFSYLNTLSNEVDEFFCLQNISYFATSVMPEFYMNYHHLEWGEIVHNRKYFCINAARDHGKSYYFSNLFPIWLAYRHQKATPYKNLPFHFTRNKRIILMSFTLQQCIDLMDIMKDTILENNRLKEKLFSSKRDAWSKTELKLKTGCRITGKSFGTSMRGVHPGTFIVDDGLTDAVLYSKTQRQKNIDYFHSVIMNAIIPGGQVAVIGTPFHQNDLYGDLKKKIGWYVKEYPAIFPNGRLLWENRYNYKNLIEKRDTQGNLIFSRELLCKPITSESSIFPIEILKRSTIGTENYSLVNNRTSFPISFDLVVISCDFAISASVGADYTVFMVWGVERDGRRWLIHFFREKGVTFQMQIAKLKSLNVNFNPDLIAMETNQMQQIFFQQGQEENLPVWGQHTGTNKNDLKAGLPGLAITFENGKIKFPTGDQYSKDIKDLIFSEFNSIAFTDNGLQGVGEHDDIPMCSWIGACGINHANSGFGFGFM